MVDAVITMKTCIPAPGGELPESPRAMIVQVIIALPRNSQKKALDTRTQSLGCVYMLIPVDSGSRAPSRYIMLS